MNPSGPYARELEIACLAVQRAALLTKTIIRAVDKGVLDKSDSTPVTVADFAAQALIISAIHSVFPNDTFVGEESSTMLRHDHALLQRVWGMVESTHDETLAVPQSIEEMLDTIDLGGKGEGGGSQGRIWVLDPVDGTATFVRRQQYAVCLALLEDGQQKLAVSGCSNLKLDPTTTSGLVHEDNVDNDSLGVMVMAVDGQGAFLQSVDRHVQTLPQRIPPRLREETINLGDLRFVDCEAAGSTSYEKHQDMAFKLGAPWPPDTDLWSSQMRHVAIAVGRCNVLIKIPRKESYRSCIWDHAGGMLIAQEVGCKITDLNGNPIDCGLGRRPAGAYGLVVAPEKVHAQVLSTVSTVQKVIQDKGL